MDEWTMNKKYSYFLSKKRIGQHYIQNIGCLIQAAVCSPLKVSDDVCM